MTLVQEQLVKLHKLLKMKKMAANVQQNELEGKERVDGAGKGEARCGANRVSIGKRRKKESFKFLSIYSSASLSDTMSLKLATPA